MDREPDDRLGRSRQRQRFEQRRQILRGYTKSDTDAYSDGDSYGYIHADTNGYVHTYAYSNIDTYGHGHAYSNSNTYCYCYSYGDSNSYTYSDTETFTDAENCTNAQAACHPATAAVTFVYEKETHCSIRFVQAECFNLFRTGLRSGHFRSCERHHGHEHQRQWPRLVAAGARRRERR